jgi:hypothetical protein
MMVLINQMRRTIIVFKRVTCIGKRSRIKCIAGIVENKCPIRRKSVWGAVYGHLRVTNFVTHAVRRSPHLQRCVLSVVPDWVGAGRE